MKKLILVACLLAATAATADAGPLRNAIQRIRGGGCGGGGCQTTAAPQQPPDGVAPAGGVQWKADAQAQVGRCFHPGGGFVSGASYEGVGFSSVSPEHALSACCNNGGPVVAQAVSQGPGGWYAVKQYGSAGGLVRATSYDGLGVPANAMPYQPIRLVTPLPTCGPNGCGR